MSKSGVAPTSGISLSGRVINLTDLSFFEASIRDFSEQGCWIVSEKAGFLTDEIGLQLEGFEKLLRGNVVAVRDNEAQVAFNFKREPKQPHEQRSEVRRPALITAYVSGRADARSMKCLIVDASRSGCRLEGDRLDTLSNEIEISVQGFELPIHGKIVWRKNGQAGVQLDWSFEENARSAAQKPASPTRKGKARKPRRLSAFGN